MLPQKLSTEELKRLYVDENYSARRIAESYGLSENSISKRLSRAGLKKGHNNREAVGLQNEKAKVIIQDSEELKYLKKKGYNLEDIIGLAKALEKQGNVNTKEYTIGGNHHKFILYGDTHWGHVQSDLKLHDHMCNTVVKENVDFVAHAGDIADGWYQSRPASIFEQNAIGFDQQMSLSVEQLKNIEAPLYFITGNHTYNTFVRGAGVEFGPILEDKLTKIGKEAHYLGNAEGNIFLNNTLLRLLHPDGGSSYAISYKSQKIAEALESGKKPNILAIGHFHKAEYIFYRNIHIFQTATLCGQSKFMKGKGLAAHKGFWLLDIYTKDNGQVDMISPTFYPSYK